MNVKALITGIVAGTAIIGATTLLTTPKSGKDVRQSCKENALKIRTGMDQFKNDSKTTSIQLKQTVKVGKETFRTIGEDVKTSVKDWQTDINPMLNKLKEDVDALQKSVSKTQR
ncbi:YtxH domain-containing protein [Halalkalibacter akibai]|uniref:Gas vesicle protein n=1 Tax=Halalkalibacter akibai (strain ATCC 43226 / DSM 21942 / CIP 109018 / JCM 9157 / 1139) TaxID=1236973 RepID=W4QUB3_HALA3|nr:YtxH domain-containing protein [Halalkalibacter akibai]GAE35676.1 hypothetical protein JCM9157_2793 [Halalkalibacter akibai JCM 9157]